MYAETIPPLERNRVIEVYDWPALIEAAGFDPRYLRFPSSKLN